LLAEEHIKDEDPKADRHQDHAPSDQQFPLYRGLPIKFGGLDEVPMVEPLESRYVVVPPLSVEAVPVVEPRASRKVTVPPLSVEAVPMVEPRESRKVVCD
jgi:hypothetical protein